MQNNNNQDDFPNDINAFDRLQQFFEQFKGELNIIDEAISVELQMEYFKTSREISKKYSKEVLFEKALLFDKTNLIDDTTQIETNEISNNGSIDSNLTLEEKKTLLIQLASIDDVKAYRIIESFVNTPNNSLKHWGLLALQESKMLMQSKLLEQNQVFISTGLGGKGTKLRYFIVLLPEKEEPFAEFQQKIIRNEFQYIFKQDDAEIEEILFCNTYATIIALVPMQVPLTDLFTKTIKECNQFGNFIKNNCIITNVKRLSEQEINDFFNQADTIIDEENENDDEQNN